jgi:YD repeat-containing protein
MLMQRTNRVRTSLTYYAANQLLAQYDLRADDSFVSGVDYRYDNAANRLGQQDAQGVITTWNYDTAYQLTHEYRSAATGGFNTTFVYDPVGNRLVKNATGARTTSTYNSANQLITSIDPAGTTMFTFDAAGNQQVEAAPSGTTTHAWDYENQRTVVVPPNSERVTMTYNGDFRCVTKES